jgi:hypothetical protein
MKERRSGFASFIGAQVAGLQSPETRQGVIHPKVDRIASNTAVSYWGLKGGAPAGFEFNTDVRLTQYPFRLVE